MGKMKRNNITGTSLQDTTQQSESLDLEEQTQTLFSCDLKFPVTVWVSGIRVYLQGFVIIMTSHNSQHLLRA